MLAGRYFDGHSSRLHRVSLSVDGNVATLAGEVERRCTLQELHVSERSTHAVRKVTFPDGACFEPDDRQAFDQLLDQTGHRDSLVVRLQRSWRSVLLAVAGTAALLVPGYLYGLPLAGDYLAQAMPVSVERQMGHGLLEVLDERMLQPSTLPAERRERIAAAFAGLRAPLAGAPIYRLQFRKSKIGPNAFALPSGDIVLTDELVKALPDDGAVLAVLSHELGHLHRRHMSRRIIQGSVVAAVGGLMFGDVNGMVSSASALLLDLNYSRDAENEADDYAADMLQANGLPLRNLEQVFEVLEREAKVRNSYLSTHPLNEERLARLRERSRE